MDRVSYLQDIHAACLYPCVAHAISVDIFHEIYLSLCDNPLILFDTMCIYVVLNLICLSSSAYKLLKSVFRTFKNSLYAFLQSDFIMFLCLLFHNQFVLAILMHCIPWKEPACRVYYIFLIMMRAMILHHDFLARIRHFYARQLTFHTNVLRFYNAGGRLRLIELMYCS